MVAASDTVDPETTVTEIDTHNDSDEPALAVEETPDDASARESERMVPVWLAALVLVLLLAVMGVGGFILGKFVSGETDQSPLAQEIIGYEREVAENPDDPAAHLSLGFAYQREGRYEDALVQYDMVLEENPKDTAALYNMGMVLLELDRDDEAEERLWDVLEVDGTHVLASKALGELYAERGQYKSLLVAVTPAADANETAADLQYLMALAYENLGDTTNAIDRYQRALTYVPDMIEAREGLARLGVSDE